MAIYLNIKNKIKKLFFKKINKIIKNKNLKNISNFDYINARIFLEVNINNIENIKIQNKNAKNNDKQKIEEFLQEKTTLNKIILQKYIKKIIPTLSSKKTNKTTIYTYFQKC